MVLVVRKDLQMGVGKIAAQCSHAAVGSVETIRSQAVASSSDNESFPTETVEQHVKWLDAWFVTGSAKIVVHAPSEDALREIHERALRSGLPSYLVIDAGRTQIASGSPTVVSVGPGPRSKVDEITSHLKLL